MSRKAFNRQEALVNYINEKIECSVEELCNHFQVSEATVRRDLTELHELKRINRVSGGARTAQTSDPEPPLNSRMSVVTEEKVEIGKRASQLIEEGETIYISSGTTAFQAARFLADFKKLTIITNSLPVIDLISRYTNLTLISLGGILRHSEQSFVGPTTEQCLKDLRADKAILGVRAIHQEQGLTNDALPETQVDRLVLKIARKVIIVADHTKFERIAPLVLAPIDTVNTIVTDSLETEEIQAYQEKGIEIITVFP